MVIQFEENKIRQQEVEVRALIALMRFGRRAARRLEAEGRLCEIAFPDKLANKINEQPLDQYNTEF